jgi:hypothetical protein
LGLTSSQIAQHEQKARTRYLSAVQHMGDPPLPGRFNDFLKQSVLPLLVRVGFDKEIAGNIFRISAPAWKSMGQVTDPKLQVHPALVKDIQEIRRDIVSQDEKKPPKLTFPAEASPNELTDIGERAMHPDALAKLLQTIPTTWIILPRAHSFLVKKDSHCLIVYLQHLDRETNLAFEKILARILIEFIGNYSLKFISSSLPKKQMVDAIFYGYAAMFWKNLRRPPPGLEDLQIFRNYLSWAKAFKKRAACKDTEKETVIAEMEEMGNNILPDRNVRTLAHHRKDRDASGMNITLRHGRPGIKHAVRYFTMNNTLFIGSNHDHLSCRTLPRQISTLFRELRNNYDRETPRTREFIHAFLMELRTTYNRRTVRSNLPRQNIPNDLAFTHGRMACMVQDFNRSLH